MDTKKQVVESLKSQFSDMLSRGIMPLFEYELNNGDFLLVELSIDDCGLWFSFDNELETFFSGEIKNKGHNFLLPFDLYFDNLDRYLQQIDLEMTEGYIIPNNLFKCEE